MSDVSSLKVDETSGVTVVSFRDASILDAATIQRVGRDLYAVIERDEKRKVVLDFEDVRFMSSQALGVLLTLRRKADRVGAQVVLARIRPELVRVFKITNLDQLFAFFDDLETALSEFAGD